MFRAITLGIMETLTMPVDYEVHHASRSTRTTLCPQESGNSRQLALAEIHSHLVRSPPPIPWPRAAQKFDFDELHESARIVVRI